MSKRSRRGKHPARLNSRTRPPSRAEGGMPASGRVLGTSAEDRGVEAREVLAGICLGMAALDRSSTTRLVIRACDLHLGSREITDAIIAGLHIRTDRQRIGNSSAERLVESFAGPVERRS